MMKLGDNKNKASEDQKRDLVELMNLFGWNSYQNQKYSFESL